MPGKRPEEDPIDYLLPALLVHISGMQLLQLARRMTRG